MDEASDVCHCCERNEFSRTFGSCCKTGHNGMIMHIGCVSLQTSPLSVADSAEVIVAGDADAVPLHVAHKRQSEVRFFIRCDWLEVFAHNQNIV